MLCFQLHAQVFSITRSRALFIGFVSSLLFYDCCRERECVCGWYIKPPLAEKAKLSIAMQSCSNVTRNVADVVLLDDPFAALRPAFTEGKRIAGGLSSSMYLLLTRIVTSTLVIVAIAMIGLGFPYEPAQGALVLCTVGIPIFFLTLWARPEPPRPHLLRSLVRFVAPAAILTAFFGVAIYAYTYTFALTPSLRSSVAQV
jgi:cation-transporting P-type ATPase E